MVNHYYKDRIFHRFSKSKTRCNTTLIFPRFLSPGTHVLISEGLNGGHSTQPLGHEEALLVLRADGALVWGAGEKEPG